MPVLRQTPLKSISYGVVLFTLLASIYLLLYRGHPLSIDEISTFDSVASFTQHGTLSRTIEFYRQPTISPDGSPYLLPLYEPLQIIAASPFYLLAQATDQFGQFHAVYLLNIIVTALTAVSLYVIALRQGYSVRTAWLGAFLFGTATLALPYSRWLFREPLMALFALCAFGAAFEVRQRMQRRQPVKWAVAVLVIALLAMILAKQIGILFLPGILLCVTPPVRALRRYLPILALGLAVILVFLIGITILDPDFGDDRYNLMRWLNPANLGLTYIIESLLGYQVSPSRSFWLYSPVLLLGFAGMVYLLKRETKWLVLGILVSFFLISGSYGALRLGAYWNGGWNWGPRYMLPLVPLWMLLLLPVIEWAQNGGRWLRTGVIAVALISAAMQIIGIAVPFTDYYNRFYPHMSPGNSWLAENWSWQNTALSYHLQNFSLSTFDTAWRFSESPFLIFVYLVALVTAALLLLRYVSRTTRLSHRRIYAACVGLVVVWALGAVLGLFTLRQDARYIGNRQDVYALVQRLNTSVAEDDVMFLSGSEYMILFMNWFKAGALYITLPDDGLFGPPDVSNGMLESNTPPTADVETRSALDWAVRHHDRIWLVMSPSSYDEDHSQWYKRYLSARMYPSGEIDISPFANTVDFVTGRNMTFKTLEFTPPPLFDAQLALQGVSIPEQESFNAGEHVPFMLRWTPIAPLPENYHISVQLLDADGVLITQRDAAPFNGYGNMSDWQPGAPYDDRYAVLLPRGLRAGEYSLHIIVYQFDTLEHLPVQIGDIAKPTDSLLLMRLRVR